MSIFPSCSLLTVKSESLNSLFMYMPEFSLSPDTSLYVL